MFSYLVSNGQSCGEYVVCASCACELSGRYSITVFDDFGVCLYCDSETMPVDYILQGELIGGGK